MQLETLVGVYERCRAFLARHHRWIGGAVMGGIAAVIGPLIYPASPAHPVWYNAIEDCKSLEETFTTAPAGIPTPHTPEEYVAVFKEQGGFTDVTASKWPNLDPDKIRIIDIGEGKNAVLFSDVGGCRDFAASVARDRARPPPSRDGAPQ